MTGLRTEPRRPPVVRIWAGVLGFGAAGAIYLWVLLMARRHGPPILGGLDPLVVDVIFLVAFAAGLAVLMGITFTAVLVYALYGRF